MTHPTLEALKAEGIERKLVKSTLVGNRIIIDGKSYFNLSSNDYLGISTRMDWQKEFFEKIDTSQFLMGCTSSRLLTGNSSAKVLLEEFIGKQYHKSCLVFNSGYHTNVGILPAITTKRDLVIADKLVHASIIDGLKLSDCQWTRFRHNDYAHLAALLEKNSKQYDTIYVVTESIFSMDGDYCDLPQLVALKKQYDFKLYLDEAHAIGVEGEHGLGYAEALGLNLDIDILVGTFSKALASEGGFVVTDEDTKQLLINKSRSFIFTTASSPISALWSLFVFQKTVNMQQERQHLKEITKLFCSLLGDRPTTGQSQIIPLLFEENKRCTAFSNQLREAGLWVSPIRYPSVPIHQPRIRLSLTAAISSSEIKQIYETILAQER